MIFTYDEVFAKVAKGEVHTGMFGILDNIDGTYIWVSLYSPADDDRPYDYMRYDKDQIKLNMGD